MRSRESKCELPLCKDNMTACSGKAAEPETEEPPEQPKEKGNTGGLVLFLVVALLGGGARSIILSL